MPPNTTVIATTTVNTTTTTYLNATWLSPTAHWTSGSWSCICEGSSTSTATSINTAQNGEVLITPTSNDVHVFVPQKNINQICNVYLAQNFISNIGQPKKVLDVDKDGDF